MNEKFVKALYESIIKENLIGYKDLYEKLEFNSTINSEWNSISEFYNKLESKDKEVFFRIIEIIMIDTISNILGIIDGSSTLNESSLEPKLFINSIDTQSELQDFFLEYIENIKK